MWHFSTMIGRTVDTQFPIENLLSKQWDEYHDFLIGLVSERPMGRRTEGMLQDQYQMPHSFADINFMAFLWTIYYIFKPAIEEIRADHIYQTHCFASA